MQGIPGTHRRTHIISEDPRTPTPFSPAPRSGSSNPRTGQDLAASKFEQVNWMVFDPEDPRTCYLATEYAGILKSTDSGERSGRQRRVCES